MCLCRDQAATTAKAAVALSSSDQAEALKGGMQLQQEQASTSSSTGGASEDASRRSNSGKANASKKIKDALVWIDLEMTGECCSKMNDHGCDQLHGCFVRCTGQHIGSLAKKKDSTMRVAHPHSAACLPAMPPG
jgi:hypothetical protein